METMQAILARRSIRKFRPDALDRRQIETVLEAGILAPSAKNRQPWRFLVISGTSRDGMLAAMAQGIEQAKKELAHIPDARMMLAGATYTMRAMKTAPVTILVFDTTTDWPPADGDELGGWYAQSANTQSLGAAIENMCLAATDLGLGSLWIGDIFSAHEELMAWAKQPGTLVAALALGVADEAPEARPRKALGDVTVWMD